MCHLDFVSSKFLSCFFLGVVTMQAYKSVDIWSKAVNCFLSAQYWDWP